MPVIYKRPHSLAAKWSRRIGLFALLMLVAIWVFHRFGDLSTPSAIGAILIMCWLAIVALGLSIIGFSMLWLIGAKGGKASFVGFLVSTLVLMAPAYGAYRYLNLPQIYDVTTAQSEKLEWISEPEKLKSWLSNEASGETLFQIKDNRYFTEINGRRYQGALDRVYEAVRFVAANTNFEITQSVGDNFLKAVEPVEQTTQSDGTKNQIIDPNADQAQSASIIMQMTYKSYVLGVHHDLMIRLVEEENTTLVDMRSALRHGPHDLGLNVELINQFLKDLDNNLAGIIGSG